MRTWGAALLTLLRLPRRVAAVVLRSLLAYLLPPLLLRVLLLLSLWDAEDERLLHLVALGVVSRGLRRRDVESQPLFQTHCDLERGRNGKCTGRLDCKLQANTARGVCA